MRPSVLLVLFDDLRTNSSALPLHMPRLAALASPPSLTAAAAASYKGERAANRSALENLELMKRERESAVRNMRAAYRLSLIHI